VVKNNLALLYGTSSSVSFISGDGTVAENNYGYAPTRTGICERPDGSSTCTDPSLVNTTDRNSPSFMLPQSGSPAIDAAIEAPVSNDFRGTPRPQGNAPDVGAVERME
jgi:hypothetical protein